MDAIYSILGKNIQACGFGNETKTVINISVRGSLIEIAEEMEKTAKLIREGKFKEAGAADFVLLPDNY